MPDIEQFYELLQSEIKPGEKVVWQAQPDAFIFIKGMAKMVPKVFGVCILVLFYTAVHSRSYMSLWTIAEILPVPVLIWLGLAIRRYFQVMKQLYVLTNQRGLILSLSTKRAINIPKSTLAIYTVSGPGDITFGKVDETVSFEGLSDIKTPLDLVKAMVKELTASGQ